MIDFLVTKDNIQLQDQTISITKKDCIELAKKNFGVIFHKS